MYQTIALLSSFALTILLMFTLTILYRKELTDIEVDKLNSGRLKQEKDQLWSLPKYNNYSIDAMKKLSCEDLTLDSIMKHGIENIRPAVFPHKPYFIVNIPADCKTGTKFRQVAGAEVSKTTGFYIVDVILEPIEMVTIPYPETPIKEFPLHTERFWYMYPAPYDPFQCHICRTMVNVEIDSKTKIEHFLKSARVVHNEFPYMIDIKRPATIRRYHRHDYQTSIVSIQHHINISHIVPLELSFFSHSQHHLLFGLAPIEKNSSSIALSPIDKTTFDAFLNKTSGWPPRAHLAMCVSNMSGDFRQLVNCYPHFSSEYNRKKMDIEIVADCVCWKTSEMKPLFLIYAFVALTTSVAILLVFKMVLFRAKPIDNSEAKGTKHKDKFMYKVFVRLALPRSQYMNGSLFIRFLDKDETNITSLTIGERSKFCKPFVGSNEVAELKVILRSPVQLRSPSLARVVFSASKENTLGALYLFGVAFSDEKNERFSVFPYSHYLGDQRMVRLCEAGVWRRKIKREFSMFEEVSLPIHSPSLSLTILEHAYMVLISFMLLPRSMLMSIAREDNIVLSTLTNSALGVFIYFVNYIIYVIFIRPLFEERYYLVQTIPGLNKSMGFVFSVFWIFALFLYLMIFIDVSFNTPYLDPITYAKAGTFHDTIVKKDMAWIFLVVMGSIIQYCTVFIIFKTVERWQHKEKPRIVLGPVESLEEQERSARRMDPPW